MPASFRIDTEHRIVFSRGWGVLSDEDLIEHQRLLAADPDFRPDLSQLANAREVTDVRATAQGVHQMIAGNPFGKGARRAFVTANDTIYGLARMFELGRVDPRDECRVFRDMDEARAWRGLPLQE
jgi:hypothetical protein